MFAVVIAVGELLCDTNYDFTNFRPASSYVFCVRGMRVIICQVNYFLGIQSGLRLPEQWLRSSLSSERVDKPDDP